MADHIVPHFHNTSGVPVIEIGAREFMCIGALPPFDHPHVFLDLGVQVIEIGAREFMCVGALPPLDHPHVFLDMGADDEIICPYCATLYRHDPALDPRAARPAECAFEPAEA